MNGYIGSALIGLSIMVLGLIMIWLTPRDDSKKRPR